MEGQRRLVLNDFASAKVKVTTDELLAERHDVADLLA